MENVIKLIGMVMDGWDKLDKKASRNLCLMIWYVFENFYEKWDKKISFVNTLLGNIFPYY